MGNKIKPHNFEEHLEMLVDDCHDIVRVLKNYNYFEGADQIEIMATLPSAINIDVFIGMVNRWRELQEMYDKPLRIYAYSYNSQVEKMFMRLIQEHDKILLTPIPGEWKGRILHA